MKVGIADSQTLGIAAAAWRRRGGKPDQSD